MAANIRDESRRKFEKQGLEKTRQALHRGIANPTEKLEAQNWIVEEEWRQQRQRTKNRLLFLALMIFVVTGIIALASMIVKG